MTKRVVLAYSGGLDTSVAVRWMIEEYGVEVIAVACNVGQEGTFDGLKERALAAGAVEAIVVDCTEEYARDFVAPALQANALYEGRYPLVSALSRPVIVKHLVAAAREHGASAVAHGCTGKGNDQVRFEVSTRALAPDLEIMAPVRSWGMTREQSIEYAAKHDIPLTATKEKLYSIDDNLWGRAIECGEMEDPWARPPEDVWSLTKATATEPREITVRFEAGLPVAVDDQAMPLHTLVKTMNEAVGAYGWGRLDMVENRRVGIKSRETYEAPGALALIQAHTDLETLTIERDLFHEKQTARAPLRRPRLRRHVVLAVEGRPRRVRGVEPAVRHRRGAAAARAGPVLRRRPAQRLQPVRLRPGDLRRGRQLQPCGLRRLREAVGARHPDLGGPPGPKGQLSEHALARSLRGRPG